MADRIQVRRDTDADWTSNDPTLAAGEPGFISDTNEFVIGDGSTALTSLVPLSLAPPTAQIRVTSAQSITSSSTTVPDFDTETWADGVTVDLAGNDLTVVRPGIYTVSLYVEWGANANGRRGMFIRKNGGAEVNKEWQPAGGGSAPHSSNELTQQLALTTSDVIDATVVQTSGGALDLNKARLTLTYVRPTPA